MKVDRKDLLTRCETVKPALRPSSSMPALAYLWFREGFVYGYDGGLGIACAMPAGAEFEGGVMGNTLLDLLSSSGKETVDFNTSDDGFDVKIGGSRAKIASTPIDRFFWNFPTEAPKKGEPLFKISEEVIQAIKTVMIVRHDSPRIPEHHGVVVISKGDQIWFVTTDTVSVAAYTVNEEAPEFTTILPRAFAQQIVKHGKTGYPIWLTDTAMSLYAGQTPGQIQIHSNSLDTEEVKDFGKLVMVHSEKAGPGVNIPDGLGEALSRAEILARKDEPKVELEAGETTLTVRGKYDGGQLHEVLDISEKDSWPERSIVVDSGLLKRSLGQATHIAIGEDSVVLYGAEGQYSYVLGSSD